MTRISRIAILALAALAFAACATALGARQALLRRGLDAHVVRRAPAEVWPEVLRFVRESGYPLVGKDRQQEGGGATGAVASLFDFGFETRNQEGGGRVLETNKNRRGIRLRVEGIPVADGCRVRITTLRKDEANPGRDQEEWRDEELELGVLRRLDPLAASRIEAGEAPAPSAQAASAPDPWSPVRFLVGAWEGEAGPGAAPARLAFSFTEGAQFIEVRGSPILGPPAPGRAPPEEMGRLSREGGGGGIVWRQFTGSGSVNQYRLERADPEALVFLAASPESLPAGSRARLTLGRAGPDEILAIFELAESGKDYAVAGEVRLRRR